MQTVPLPCSAGQRHIPGPTLTGWESHWDVGSSGLLNGLPATETVSIFFNPQRGLMVLGKASCHGKERRDPTEDCEPGLSCDSGGVFLYLVSFGKLWLFPTRALEASRLPEPIVPAATAAVIGPAFELRDSLKSSLGKSSVSL